MNHHNNNNYFMVEENAKPAQMLKIDSRVVLSPDSVSIFFCIGSPSNLSTSKIGVKISLRFAFQFFPLMIAIIEYQIIASFQ